MSPTPNFRPYAVYVSKSLYWALGRISDGLRGDGPSSPENTRDGVTDALLSDIIEVRCPGLLDGYKQRQKLDDEWAAKVSASLRKEKHAWDQANKQKSTRCDMKLI